MYPLFEEWHRFLGDGLSDDMMKNLRGNQAKWEMLVQQEIAEETKTEISDAEVLDEEILADNSEDVIQESTESTELLSSERTRRGSFLTIPDINSCHQRVGRRHSVPLSVPSPPAVTRTIIRRESLAIGEQRANRQFGSGFLEEEEEELMNLGQSSLSLVSSTNKSNEGSVHEERPVSAENLLPEPSIASITTVTEASRLSSVLHGGTSPLGNPPKSQLTRQQTFPPLQPYVRQRYMSTTAEMSTCSDGLMEKSNSSGSSKTDLNSNRGLSREGSGDSPSESHCGTKHGCRTPPLSRGCVLRESNRSSKQSDSDRGSGGKRETDCSSREKGIKVAKLSDDTMVGLCEKENVDPKGSDLELDGSSLKCGNIRRNSTQASRLVVFHDLDFEITEKPYLESRRILNTFTSASVSLSRFK